MSDVLQFDMQPIASRLSHETDRLREWFKIDYPESDLRVEADFNGVLFVLKIDITVLMGEETVEKTTQDRGYFKSTIRLLEKDLRNPSLMEGFFREFNTQVRKQIQNSFNSHYNLQKQKAGVL